MATDFGQFSIPELLSPREPLPAGEAAITRQQQQQNSLLAVAPDGGASDAGDRAAFAEPFRERTAPFTFDDNPLGALATTVNQGPESDSPTKSDRNPAVALASQGPFTPSGRDGGVGSILNTLAPESYGPGQLVDLVS